MPNRSKIKILGRAPDIFPGRAARARPTQNITGTPLQQRSRAGMYPKATYYLPPELQERLDDVWMKKRKDNRKLTKSDLVRQALEQYLEQEG